jgi:hypothetical protein
MSYCRPCPDCGANLDPGEKCTCRKVSEQLAKKYELITTVTKEGQIEFGENDEDSKINSQEFVWN